MKVLFLFSLVGIMALGTSPFLDVSEDRIIIEFNNDVEFDDLIEMKKELTEAGVTIRYKDLEFDEYKKLKRISLYVDFEDGFSGNLQTPPLEKDSKVGFIRDYKSKDTPLLIGDFKHFQIKR